jgi:hypothetical protein
MLAFMSVFVVDFLFFENMSEEVVITLETAIVVLLFFIIVGTVSTVVGGYIAARVAKKAIYLNSSMVGLIGIVIGLLSGDEHPLRFNVLASIFILPSALLGGYLAGLRQTSNGPWKRARRRIKAMVCTPRC